MQLKRKLAKTRFGHYLRNIVRWPSHTRYCPLCQRFQPEFLPHGIVPRPNARCPDCGALERHRLAGLYMQQQLALFERPPRLMLHVAPETALEPLFRRVPAVKRVTADLLRRDVKTRLDLTALPFADDTFDAIYCSHVLEHVPDDAAAMAELQRVLRPGGWAILQVPILREQTDEDPSVVRPEDRLRRFGQQDHVRVYGLDYADRLKQSGFEVQVDDFTRRIPPARRAYLGLDPRENVYLCRKAGG